MSSRSGSIHKILGPGINFLIPFIDAVKKPVKGSADTVSTWIDGAKVPIWSDDGSLNMAETRMDPPETRNLYTKDNTQVTVDSVAYFKIIDPYKLVYEVSAFADSFRSMVETTLRQGVGKYTSDSIITSRESLGQELREAVQEASSNWGVQIVRIEIQDIEFSDPEVVKALSDARANELERRATLVATQAKADALVLESDAIKRAKLNESEAQKLSSILLAEGEKQRKILEAEGEFEKRRLEAEADFLETSRPLEGQAKGYAAIIEALGNNAAPLLQLEALRSQAQIAQSLGNANTIVVPSEAAGLVGAAAVATKILEKLK